MTEKDKALIEEAREHVRLGDHNGVDALMREAESEEAKTKLHRMSCDAFRRERLAFELD